MGTSVIAGNFIAFNCGSYQLTRKCARLCFYDHSRPKVGGRADSASKIQLRHVFWLSTLGLTAIAWLTAPFAGVMASFYTQDPQVKHVVVILIWLNALFMPIWSASWVLPAGFKGARDARYAMWVSMLSMWGCRLSSVMCWASCLAGCGWCLDGNVCRLGCAGRAVLLANGYWTLAVEIPSIRTAKV